MKTLNGSILIGAAVTFLLVAATSICIFAVKSLKTKPEKSSSGRYQFIDAGDRIFDTQTGAMYRLYDMETPINPK